MTSGLLSFTIEPPFENSIWKYDDVRLIDPIDSTDNQNEIIAFYTRHYSNLLQVRIDFLSMSIISQPTILLFIENTRPGAYTALRSDSSINVLWDYCLIISNSQSMTLVNSNFQRVRGVSLLLTRDINQATVNVTIRGIKQISINSHSRFWFTVNDSVTGKELDRISPVLLDAPPPPPLQVELLFWNVFDASTPATALRSWDGAHTGPQSSRHGLKYLLEAASKYAIPIHLIWSCQSGAWNVVEYMDFGGLFDYLFSRYLLSMEGGWCVIDYTKFIENVIASEESMENILEQLLYSYSSNNTTVIKIGGDLAYSHFGSPNFVDDVFSYFKQHPWIMTTLGSSDGRPFLSPTPPPSQSWVTAATTEIQTTPAYPPDSLQLFVQSGVITAPPNRITFLARRTYSELMLTSVPHISLSRESYLAQIGHMLAAAEWADNPIPAQTCEVDIDWDGSYECILANEHFFLTFELEGGYLAFGFVLTSTGVHQILGATTQFALSRSDPSEINPERGLISDRNQIPGTFADSPNNWLIYQWIYKPQGLILHNQDESVIKEFSLINQNELLIRTTFSIPDIQTSLYLPIVLDPWQRDAPGFITNYWHYGEPKIFRWGYLDQVFLTVISDNPFTATYFNSSTPFLTNPEDPNFDYTPGHLLPFPMALITLTPQTENTILVSVDH
jgi:hypothetical protein